MGTDISSLMLLMNSEDIAQTVWVVFIPCRKYPIYTFSWAIPQDQISLLPLLLWDLKWLIRPLWKERGSSSTDRGGWHGSEVGELWHSTPLLLLMEGPLNARSQGSQYHPQMLHFKSDKSWAREPQVTKKMISFFEEALSTSCLFFPLPRNLWWRQSPGWSACFDLLHMQTTWSGQNS